jgi:hypothetical protein
MAVQSADGQEAVVGAGEAFEVGAGHDAWVLGDAPCVALDFEHLSQARSEGMEEWKG